MSCLKLHNDFVLMAFCLQTNSTLKGEKAGFHKKKKSQSTKQTVYEISSTSWLFSNVSKAIHELVLFGLHINKLPKKSILNQLSHKNEWKADFSNYTFKFPDRIVPICFTPCLRYFSVFIYHGWIFIRRLTADISRRNQFI